MVSSWIVVTMACLVASTQGTNLGLLPNLVTSGPVVKFLSDRVVSSGYNVGLISDVLDVSATLLKSVCATLNTTSTITTTTKTVSPVSTVVAQPLSPLVHFPYLQQPLVTDVVEQVPAVLQPAAIVPSIPSSIVTSETTITSILQTFSKFYYYNSVDDMGLCSTITVKTYGYVTNACMKYAYGSNVGLVTGGQELTHLIATHDSVSILDIAFQDWYHPTVVFAPTFLPGFRAQLEVVDLTFDAAISSACMVCDVRVSHTASVLYTAPDLTFCLGPDTIYDSFSPLKKIFG